MVDLSKREVVQEVNNEVNNEINNEINNEVKQADISKVQPTTMVNNAVRNVNINKTVINKQYKIFELIGLSFKYVNKNIGKVFMCLFGIIIAALIFLVPISVMMFDLEEYSQGNLGLIVTMVIMVVLFIMMCVWVVTKTITNIDTGIERIESQKSKGPMGRSFWRLCGLQFLTTTLSFLMYALVELTAGVVVIYVWLLIQMQIFSFLLNNYTLFGYYEILAKGENLSNSLANTFTNLFFSKNGIILKSLVGYLIFALISLVTVLAMVSSDVFIEALTYVMSNVALAKGIGRILGIVLGLIMVYVGFASMMYTYLVYMLNEVRDDKIDTLR